MSDSLLEKLKNNRDTILLSEIGAYLHLLGRFSKEFIESQAENSNINFKYEDICNNPNFFENTGLDGVLKDNKWEKRLNKFIGVQDLGELSSNRINNFCDYIKNHTWKKEGKKPEEGLCRILADAHGIVSGIDKALAGGKGKIGKQRKDYTFKSSAFGYEIELEFLKNPELKKQLFEKIKDLLKRIRDKNFNEDNYDLYKKFVELISEYYPKTIGETRRPINEITLFDYAYTIASLMKSNLAKMVIEGWFEPKRRSQWRILKVNIDEIGYISKGLKIGDILGRKKGIEEVYESVKKLIEYSYPLGNKIYRDSTGIYFSMPGLENSNIKNLKKELFEKIKNLNDLDFDFHLDISEARRSLTILGRERENSIKNIVFPHIEDGSKFSGGDKDTNDTDMCPVCKLRFKNEKEERCKTCNERHIKRAKKWIENPKESI